MNPRPILIATCIAIATVAFIYLSLGGCAKAPSAPSFTHRATPADDLFEKYPVVYYPLVAYIDENGNGYGTLSVSWKGVSVGFIEYQTGKRFKQYSEKDQAHKKPYITVNGQKYTPHPTTHSPVDPTEPDYPIVEMLGRKITDKEGNQYDIGHLRWDSEVILTFIEYLTGPDKGVTDELRHDNEAHPQLENRYILTNSQKYYLHRLQHPPKGNAPGNASVPPRSDEDRPVDLTQNENKAGKPGQRFSIQNRTSYTVHYQIKWTPNTPWKPSSIKPDHIRTHQSAQPHGNQPHEYPQIRFDYIAEDQETTYRTYRLQTNPRMDDHAYHFEYNFKTQVIDLRDYE